MRQHERPEGGLEDESEQLDRNFIELLNELRVSGTGVQLGRVLIGHRRDQRAPGPMAAPPPPPPPDAAG